MIWPVIAALLKIAALKNCQMAKWPHDTASYLLYLTTCFTSGCQHRDAWNCIDESERVERRSVATAPVKSRRSSRCTLNEAGITSARRSTFRKLRTTPFAGLLIKKQSRLPAGA